jgi:hypothetical protein
MTSSNLNNFALTLTVWPVSRASLSARANTCAAEPGRADFNASKGALLGLRRRWQLKG